MSNLLSGGAMARGDAGAGGASAPGTRCRERGRGGRPGVGALIEEVFQSAGYNVLMVQDGTQALSISQEYAGLIDYFSAITSQRCDHAENERKEVAARLTEVRPDMPALFMSGYTKNEMAQNVKLGCGSPLPSKAWTPKSLDATRAVRENRCAAQRSSAPATRWMRPHAPSAKKPPSQRFPHGHPPAHHRGIEP
jgi:CheY-like chemotaxis protein